MLTYLHVSLFVHAQENADICFCIFFTDDDSRVVLHTDNQDGSNYINASFIDVSSSINHCLEVNSCMEATCVIV